MSRPNPIEGIEPSGVFQASYQYRNAVVSVYQTYSYVNLCKKGFSFFIYIVDIHFILSCVLRHKTSRFITTPNPSVSYYCL